MKTKQLYILCNSLLIINIIALCLEMLVLFFLMQHPMQGNNLLFRSLSAIVLLTMVYWKGFFIFIIALSSFNAIYLFKYCKINEPLFLSRIKQEIIFLTFGIAISMFLGFIYSMGTIGGKPDVNPELFTSYFVTFFVTYLIIRIGIGVLGYVRSNKRINLLTKNGISARKDS